MAEHTEYPWLEAVRTRKLTGVILWALDILEPFGPLSAQLLYIAQPTFGIFGGRQVVGDIAHALEQPEGLAHLRQVLKDATD
ncbi:MAG: hypothetical protein D6712_14560 [Chloroflexi bacterium]|nr:MAG: hypothetical protein D6712_14560 [Chloroflexota bacterium]